MRRLLAGTILTILVACLAADSLAQSSTSGDNSYKNLVSLIKVIANPNDFNGQPVKVVGFLSHGGGLDDAVGLFVSEIDGRNYIVPNSIDLHLDESTAKSLMGRYVVLSGTYHAPVAQSGYNGYIDHIHDVKALSPHGALLP